MSRLTYSPGATFRALQMSRARLHVFVEGRQLDAYVYGNLIALECPRPFEYRIRRADELPGPAGGGKHKLIKMHDLLRARGSLTDHFQGSAYTCVFFLDKDVDDLLGKRKRSVHVVYTPTYDLEGDVYRNGDLAEAVAATCSMDRGQLVTTYGSSATWTAHVMAMWRDWVTLCITAQLVRAHCVCNFGVPTRVNPNPLQPSDARQVRAHLAQIEQGANLTPRGVRDRYLSAQRRVAARYTGGRAGEIFKGKWFGVALDYDVSTRFPVEHHRVAGFKDRVLGHLAQSLDYGTSTWAETYRAPVRRLLADI